MEAFRRIIYFILDFAFPASEKHIQFQGRRESINIKTMVVDLNNGFAKVNSRITTYVDHQARELQVKIGYGSIQKWLDLGEGFHDQVINKN